VTRSLLADCAYDARGRASIAAARALHQLQDLVVPRFDWSKWNPPAPKPPKPPKCDNVECSFGLRRRTGNGAQDVGAGARADEVIE
jgi:hypothetical protein